MILAMRTGVAVQQWLDGPPEAMDLALHILAEEDRRSH